MSNIYQKFGKRLFDLCIALPLFIFLSIPMSLISAIVYANFGSPIFFRQIRPGYRGKAFTIYKFRTMMNTIDQNGNLLQDKDRLKPFGRLLREMSIDELPELFNVLNGEMSLVGPRPLLIQYLERYTPEQARRHEVKPGITGWAQVNGRNAITWEKKFKLDVWYVDNQSMWLDLKIISLTVLKILKREGITQQGHVTSEEFKGNHQKS
jgi:sugar transferase EpsL